MDANEYQNLAARTLSKSVDFKISDSEQLLIWHALGLSGEAGEIVDIIKKGVFHHHGIDRAELTKELGDVMWYLAVMCTSLGIPLSTIMAQNIEKLKKRYPDGFNVEDSIARVDVPNPA